MLCCCLNATIIGIPFAIQHLKLAYISLAPIGKTVVFKQLLWQGILAGLVTTDVAIGLYPSDFMASCLGYKLSNFIWFYKAQHVYASGFEIERLEIQF